MPGVEVHAQLLEAALTNSLLASPSYAVVVEMLGALVAGSALSLLAPVASVLALLALQHLRRRLSLLHPGLLTAATKCCSMRRFH